MGPRTHEPLAAYIICQCVILYQIYSGVTKVGVTWDGNWWWWSSKKLQWRLFYF